MSDGRGSLRDTIIPKSDQMNYDDVMAGPMTVTVRTLGRGNAEQPVIVELEGGLRPYKPCKSMRRVLIAAWGDQGKDWVGQSMTLYGEPSVKYAGQEVGGIRISHVTGISEPLVIKLTTTRSKRADFTVLPLVVEGGAQ